MKNEIIIIISTISLLFSLGEMPKKWGSKEAPIKKETIKSTVTTLTEMEFYIKNIVELATIFYESHKRLPNNTLELINFKKQWKSIDINFVLENWQIKYDWFNEGEGTGIEGTIYFNSTESYPGERLTITYIIDEDTFDYYYWPDWLIEMDNLQKALDSGEITQEEYDEKKKKIKW